MSERLRRCDSIRLQLLPMTRRFGAIAAGGHVAPATATVLGVVEEYTLAAWIGASPNARQLPENQRIGGRLDDRDDEAGERIADGDEGADEGAVAALLDAACAG